MGEKPRAVAKLRQSEAPARPFDAPRVAERQHLLRVELVRCVPGSLPGEDRHSAFVVTPESGNRDQSQRQRDGAAGFQDVGEGDDTPIVVQARLARGPDDAASDAPVARMDQRPRLAPDRASEFSRSVEDEVWPVEKRF